MAHGLDSRGLAESGLARDLSDGEHGLAAKLAKDDTGRPRRALECGYLLIALNKKFLRGRKRLLGIARGLDNTLQKETHPCLPIAIPADGVQRLVVERPVFLEKRLG